MPILPSISLPKLPNGLKTVEVNLGISWVKNSIRHEDSRATQLANIRKQVAPQPPQPLLPKSEYLKVATPERLLQHQQEMASNREALDKALSGLEALESPEQPYSSQDQRQRRTVGGTLKKLVSSIGGAGLLSLPDDGPPKMHKAMQTPLSRKEREDKRRILNIFRKRKEPRTSAQLLDEKARNAHIGAQHLEHVKHLQKRQGELLESAAHYPRLNQLARLNSHLPELTRLAKQREELLFERGRWNLEPAPTAGSGSNDDIDAKLNDNANEIRELLTGVVNPTQLNEKKIWALTHALTWSKERQEKFDEFDALSKSLNTSFFRNDGTASTSGAAASGKDDASRKMVEEMLVATEAAPADKETVDALVRLADLFPISEIRGNELQAEYKNLGDANALLKRTEAYVDKNIKAAMEQSLEECWMLAADLPGFDKDADGVQRQLLTEKLGTLLSRLEKQEGLAKDALDPAKVFQYAYQAIVNTLAATDSDPDPQRANEVLEKLLAPDNSLASNQGQHFKTVLDQLMPATISDGDATAVPDMERVLRALAPLRRGMEVIHRITAEDGYAPKLQARGLSSLDQAAKMFLEAGKARAEKGEEINGSTTQLLNAVQSEARAMFRKEAGLAVEEEGGEIGASISQPLGTLADPALTKGIATIAARNRLLEAGVGTDLQLVTDRLEKANEQWLRRAVNRINRTTGAIGQGSHTGIRKGANLLPTIGKTPLSAEAIKQVRMTSTAFGIDSAKTGAQIDEYVNKSAGMLQEAVRKLAQGYPNTMPLPLLMQRAATEIAQESIKATQHIKIRPEHYELNEEDIDRAIGRFAELAVEAGIDNRDGQVTNFSAQIRNSLPEHLSQPLKGENLFQWKNELLTQIDAVAVPQDDPARKNASEAFAVVRRLEDLFGVGEPEKIQSQEDIYKSLAGKIEQLQLRGKVRMIGGGLLGGNVKPINYTFKVLREAVYIAQLIASLGSGAVSAAPKVRLEGQFGRNAVLEISMSTVGFEISLVSETKTATTRGGGFGVSAGNAAIKGKVSADKSFPKEDVQQQGIKFMIPRSVNKEYTDDQMRLEARKLFDLVFQMQVNEKGEVERMGPSLFNNGNDVNGISNRLAQIMSECPHVSIAVINDMSDIIRKQETGVNASVKSPYPLGNGPASLAPAGSVKSTLLDSREVNVTEKTGYHNVERHNYAIGGQVSVNGGAGVAATAGTVYTDTASHTFGVNMPGVNTSRQIMLKGKDAKLRLVSIHGKTDATNTRRDVEHTSVASLESSIKANFEAWVELGVEQLFKTEDYKRYANASWSDKRRVVEKHLNETIAELERRDHAEDGRRVLRNVFAESYRLSDAASAQYDGLRDMETQAQTRLNMLKERYALLKTVPGASDDSKQALKNEIKEADETRNILRRTQDALLQLDASWMPWKITASERTLESDQKGMDLFAKIGVVNAAEGQRPMKSWPA